MTVAIILLTSIISLAALSNHELMQRLLLSPYLTVHRKQWYRPLTHAAVHANMPHLIINMIVLLSFGRAVERILTDLQYAGLIQHPTLHYLLLYLGGALIASLPSIRKYRNTYSYQSVGASGAVSGMVFFTIFFNPLNRLYLMGVIPIPGILFAVGYLVYSHYMGRKEGGTINHDAHFVGAIFGFLYPIIINPKLFLYFLSRMGLTG